MLEDFGLEPERFRVEWMSSSEGNKFADVMTVLREMAVQEGHVPKERLAQLDDLDEFVQDLRCNLVKFILNPEKEQGEKVRSMLDKEISQEK